MEQKLIIKIFALNGGGNTGRKYQEIYVNKKVSHCRCVCVSAMVSEIYGKYKTQFFCEDSLIDNFPNLHDSQNFKILIISRVIN